MKDLSRRTMLKLFASFPLVGAAPLLGPRLAWAQSGKMQIFIGTAPHFGNIVVADDRGFFKKEGLDTELTPFASGSIACEAFAAGQGHAADCGDLGALKLWTKNSVGICPTAKSGTWSIVVGGKGINSATDMRGKKVGVLMGSTSEYFARIYFAKAGMKMTDVDVVNLRPPEMVTGLVQKDIDAFVLWEPFGTRVSEATKGEARILATGGDYFTEWMIATASRDFIAKSRSQLVAYMRGLDAASKWCNANPSEAADVYSKRMKVKELDISRKMFAAAQWTVAYTPEFRRDMERLGEFINVKIDWATMFDPSFLKQANPALVS
jgi:ABC-type nitrate/sulfonate/bicarbonate transport system substrate-binding protein